MKGKFLIPRHHPAMSFRCAVIGQHAIMKTNDN
jgi:hypothetical protein